MSLNDPNLTVYFWGLWSKIALWEFCCCKVFLQLKECQTLVRKHHAEYKKSLIERDPADISKEFSIRCQLRQLNLSIQEHDTLVEKQREIERSKTELEQNPPRYIYRSL